MLNNEEFLKQYLENIEFDDTPNPFHQEKVEKLLVSRLVRNKRPSGVSGILTFRRFKMNRIPRIAAAIIIVAAVAGLVAFLTLGNGGASVTFAEVAKNVHQASTMKFTATMYFPGEEPRVVEYLFKKPWLMKSVMKDGSTIIRDFGQGIQLSLIPKTKKAMLIDMNNWPENHRILIRDQYWQMKKLFDRPGRPLGVKKIDGQDATGFQVIHKGQLFDIWVDAKTRYPIRVEHWIPGDILYVMDKFSFDDELDDSLFSVKPPNEYAVRHVALGIKKEWPENDLITGLQFLAENNEDIFPPELALTPGVVKKLRGQIRNNNDLSLPEKRERMKEENHAFFGLVGFVYNNPELVDWQYAGKGVKLGDAETAIFWYKPKDSDIYRVIYGDLSVKDVAKENLPTKPDDAVGSE